MPDFAQPFRSLPDARRRELIEMGPHYGTDEALYDARSVVSHAANIDVPFLIAVAEYENPYLDIYSAEMAHRVGLRNGSLPVFIQMSAQNHTSMVAHFDAG